MVYVPSWPSGHQSPSYDLYLFDLRLGEQWSDGLARALDAEPAVPTPEQVTGYERLEAEAAVLLPGTSTQRAGDQVLIDHPSTGIAIWLGAHLVTIDAGYDAEGDEADALVATLQAVARVAEAATGWRTYDPQADALFLGDADRTAAARISAETRRMG